MREPSPLIAFVLGDPGASQASDALDWFRINRIMRVTAQTIFGSSNSIRAPTGVTP